MRLFRRPPTTEGSAAPVMELHAVEGLAIARKGKSIVAASTAARLLKEGSYPDVLYFPAENIHPTAHLPVEGTTTCPWKGEANYYTADGAPKAAWTYYSAKDLVAEISGMIAYNDAYIDVETLSLPAVPAEAEEVLTFWLEETPSELHFRVDPELDAAIAARFGALFDEAARGALDDWQETPRGTLALLILLDQFSRNLFRGKAEAFAQDEKAQGIAARLVEKGWDLALSPDERAFAYLPFMHAEDMDLQNRSVDLFMSRLPGSTNVSYALGHRKTFHQHGRFPGRYEARGITS
ncbi:DUF924 family protein [Parvularcula marina]|uniref:DUF924 family protein n=1 Tax=Parvularcula marina TaxID=2292771 RepID=A0A371RLF7_9PROT|nr:DUF924 family protein [Parvularcula marina]RFB06206.1 DUF924 family protein [Parvularcula marina]